MSDEHVHPVTDELSLPEEANSRRQDLTSTEIRSGKDYRVIGGDKGDLRFKGYRLEDGKTVLDDPQVETALGNLTQEEINDIAHEILMESYESVGVETVEHS